LNNKKFLNHLSLFSLAAACSFGILFGMAAMHHSEPPRIDNLPPACAGALQRIHYPQNSLNRDDCTIRHWYNEQLKNIPLIVQPLQQQSLPVREQARCAFSLRHQLRIEARAAMPSAVEVDILRVRDVLRYGHFDGPEFLQLAGTAPDESAYRQIIASAARTDAQVNEVCE
jgi:hypothetical protein